MTDLNIRDVLAHADHCISSGDFDQAWKALQDVLRCFRMVPGLRAREPRQLWRLIRLFERIQRESDYKPLDEALESARQMYKEVTEGKEDEPPHAD